MAFAYVLDPTNQFQNRAGVNNVHGFFKVYLADTDDTAVTYKDFSGTLNPELIEIDNNGRAVIIADSSRPYRVEMYEPNGDLVFTQYPVWCLASGGGMSMVDIESTDGSVSVQKTSSGGMVNYDLSVNDNDDPDFLDWIKCSWYDLVDGKYVPRYSDGTMEVGTSGVKLAAGMLYHVTATMRANKANASPWYNNVGLHFYLFDGENAVAVDNFTRNVDHSLILSEDFTIDADIKVGSLPCQLYVTADGLDEGVTFDLVSLEAHRVYSGVPMLPDGVARKSWVQDNYQEKLTAGTGISIDPATNTISADAQAQQQADWAQTNTQAVDYIKNKPNLAEVATTGDYADLNNKPDLAEVATSGSYDDLSDKPSIPAAQVQSDWSQSNSSSVDYIKNKPNLATVATSGSYNDLSDKPDIPSQQVQSDWTEDDTNDPAYIKNKPSLATVATSGSYDDLQDKPSIPAAQVQSDWNQSNSAAVDYIKNKPSIPVVPSMKNLVAGQNVTITEDNDDIVISAEGGGGQFTQEQANWNETDTSSPAYILNKPTIPAAQVQSDWSQSDNTAVDYIKNKPSIPAAQVQSDWSQSDNSAVDYIKNKPSLATVATSGDYDDLQNKPSIPAAQVQSDWNQSNSAAVDYIKNKPTIPEGVPSYTGSDDGKVLGVVDEQGTPTLEWVEPSAPQVQADWTEQDTNDPSYIQNKPSLASVATSGSYDDLQDKPSIPAAQVQSDWSQSDNTQVDYIKNKPSLASVATSGDYADLSNKPTIPAAQVQSDWNEQDSNAVDYIKNKPNLASVATSGSYNDLSDKPSIPAAQVQSDWTEQDTSSKAYIQNKPSLAAVATSGNYSDLNGTPTIPTVDQTYDGTSTDAQSGVAVAQAVSGKEDEFDAGEGLEFTTDGQGNRVLQVEGPVDIVAGPGIVIDNPDGNTLRVSQAYPTDETVIWSGTTGAANDTVALSEAYSNFEKIAIYAKSVYTDTPTILTFAVVSGITDFRFTVMSFDGSNTYEWICRLAIDSTTGLSVGRSQILTQGLTGSSRSSAAAATSGDKSIAITKIVGIHRVASN